MIGVGSRALRIRTVCTVGDKTLRSKDEIERRNDLARVATDYAARQGKPLTLVAEFDADGVLGDFFIFTYDEPREIIHDMMEKARKPR